MLRLMRIQIEQISPEVGAIDKNLALLRGYLTADADIILFPELCISGYPPEDLVLLPAFQEACRDAVLSLAAETKQGGAALMVGAPWAEDGKIYNATFLLADGGIAHRQYKHALPNYGVFDEARLFSAGALPKPFQFRNETFGLLICEDLWDQTVPVSLAGSSLVFSINASPYEVNKTALRRQRARHAAAQTGAPLIYVNQLCGQDDLVFDGGSFVLNAAGEEILTLPHFEVGSAVLAFSNSSLNVVPEHPMERGSGLRSPAGAQDRNDSAPPPETAIAVSDSLTNGELSYIYQAMMLALSAYVEKNHFPGVLIGLSGGIDSALSAAIAVDALGAERVQTVMLPSEFTSQESLEDAARCAEMLGCLYDIIPIDSARAAVTQELLPFFEGTKPGLAEENIQSRLRGLLLMALSNKYGKMVLSTGNKSEMAVGYATLYGDMCGGYNVLKDVYKSTVFELARWRNAHIPPAAKGGNAMAMPERVITKPPSAELRHDQKDEDSLPPYPVLDEILRHFIEGQMRPRDIIAKGFDEAAVRHIVQLVHRAEYKRRQSPPGVKIGTRPFSRDRRFPITNGFF